MTYYVTGYYQGKSNSKNGKTNLFFLKCEEAEAPTGTMVEVDAAKPVSELSEKEQLEIFQIYTR